MAERRPTSMPLPERRGQVSSSGGGGSVTTSAAPGGPAVQGSAELQAALSRRFRIVEGGTSTGSAGYMGMKSMASRGHSTGGGSAVVSSASEAMERLQQSAESSAQCGSAPCRSSGGAPGPGALRMVQTQQGQSNTRTQSSPGTTYGFVAGLPPPPMAGAPGCAPSSGTTRYPIVQSSGNPRSAGAAASVAQPGWTQLSSDRIRKCTWPRSEQPRPPTPTSSGGGTSLSATVAMCTAAVAGVASPRSGGSEILVAAQQRFGRFSAPPPLVASSVTQAARSWRSSRDASDQLGQQDVLVLSARQARRDSHPVSSHMGDLAELKRDIAVYMDLAREEKQAKHEAVAAQRVAEARVEDALREQRAVEQRLVEQAQEAEQLRVRNAALESRIHALERPPAMDTPSSAASEVLRLQAIIAGLEREVAALREERKSHAIEVAEKIGDTLHRSNTELEVYRNQMKEEVAMRGRMDAEMAVIRAEKRKLADELHRLRRDYSELHRSNAGLEEEFADLREQSERRAREARHSSQEREELREANSLLLKQHQDLTTTLAQERRRAPRFDDASPGGASGEATPTGASSESRLRSALAGGGASTAELGQAIAAVESLLGEARRELQSRQLRERRAAYEALHKAEGTDDEAVLERALAEARRTEVDQEELDKAEAALEKLRSMPQEERIAREAAKRRAKTKEQAFLLVKRDDAEALRVLLSAADEDEASLPSGARGLRWPDWKDHSGRSLLRASTELRSKAAHEAVRALLEARAEEDPPSAPPEPRRQAPAPSEAASTDHASASPERSPVLHAEAAAKAAGGAKLCGLPSAFGAPPRAAAPPPRLPQFGGELGTGHLGPAPETTPEAPTPTPSAEGQETIKDEEELRSKAFRAVVKDDTASLAEVIVDRVPTAIWSSWKNKAGKDLLTLSEERGSSAAYSVVAKALGLLKERARESYEEREAVWVLFTGEVQPRRATVLEDTPPEADDVLLEFWDGDDPASRIDRSYLLKACG